MRWDQYQCSMQDCDTKVQARGLCSLHYWRWVRYGDPRKRPDPKWGRSIKENQFSCERAQFGVTPEQVKEQAA